MSFSAAFSTNSLIEGLADPLSARPTIGGFAAGGGVDVDWPKAGWPKAGCDDAPDMPLGDGADD